MPYTPTNWVDNTTPLSAANLNNLETQYTESMADGGIPYAVDTSATANTVIASISPAPASYTEGLAGCIKIANTTTGATTLNLNGLGAVTVKNGDGSAVGAGDLNAGVPVTFRYVGGASPAFIAQGSGGLSSAGNATVADVLTGYTFTSATGKGQAGTMPNNGAVNITPSSSNQGIPAGYTTGGTVYGVNVPAADVLTGTTIAGVAGTMPNQGSPTLQPGQSIPAGYYGGGGVNGVKVARGTATAAASTTTFYTYGGATTTQFCAVTIPVPAGITQLLSVYASYNASFTPPATGEAYGGSIFATPQGYADGAAASVLAIYTGMYSGSSQGSSGIYFNFISGGALALSTGSIVLPGGISDVYYYVIYYL